MSKVRKLTDGNFFVESWIGKDENGVKSARANSTDLKHYIKVYQGCTLPMNVKVCGHLPQGTNEIAFLVNNQKEAYWEKPINRLTSTFPDCRRCGLSIHGNPGSQVRVHCEKVEYEDIWSPDPKSWKECSQNMPLVCLLEIN